MACFTLQPDEIIDPDNPRAFYGDDPEATLTSTWKVVKIPETRIGW